MRAAVIGAGAMGRHHVRVYHELDEVDIVAVADPDPDRRQAVARRFPVQCWPDVAQLLAAEELDLVSVAVPSQQHRQVASAAIEAGLPVLVEKPLASTAEEARTLIALAERRGVLLTVGHVERFNPAVLELRRRLAAGQLGRVFKIKARRLGPFPERVRDVGVVIDLATHDPDLMAWLIGAPVTRVYAETARQIHTAHEDLLLGQLRFADGTIGSLDIDWLTPTKVRELIVTGERGMFVVNYLTQELYFYANDAADSRWEALGILTGVSEGNMTRIRIERREPLAAELAAFVAAVRDGAPLQVTAADGLAALQLAEALVASGCESRAIDLAVDVPLPLAAGR
jgi:predicted dehydrogenase